MRESLQFCQRCWLPSSYPKITFDKKGICNACREIEQKWGTPPKPKGLPKLKEFLKEVVSPDAQFQAVVTVSGGKDSSYVLYLAVRVLKLRVMAANFDHGFQSEIARDNLKKITEQLKVPLMIFRSPQSALNKIYCKFWLDTGDFCTPCCSGCRASGFYVARAVNTNLILHGGIGGSPYAFNVLGFLNHSYGRYLKYGRGAETDLMVESLAVKDEEQKPFVLVSLPQYLDWQDKKVLSEIKNKLGWEARERVYHADCLVDPASDFYLIKKFGFSKAWMYTSMLLRTGQITKKQALKHLESELPEPRKELNLFRNKVLKPQGITSKLGKYQKKSIYNDLKKWLTAVENG